MGRRRPKNRWTAPGVVTPSLPILDWDALERLAVAGVSVGSHTRTHCDLRGLGDAALEDELCGSAQALEARLGIRPRHFAYPYGFVDERAAHAARAVYALGCTTTFRVMGSNDDPLRLPRLDMYYFRRPGSLEAWGSSQFMQHLW